MQLILYSVTPYLISITVLGIFWILIIYWKQNQNLPPGPYGLPFLGYYPFLSSTPYIEFAELAKKYGNVFRFRTLGGKFIIVVNGIQNINEILVNRSEEFIGRPKESNLIDWISDGNGILQEEGLPWKKHRHFFIQSLRKLGLGNQDTELTIQEEIKTLIKDIRNAKGKPIDFGFHIAYVVNSVINPVLFSKKFEKYSKEFKEVADGSRYLVDLFIDKKYLLVGYIYKYIVMGFLPSTKSIRKAKQSFIDLTKAIVDEHIKTFDPDNIRDYVDCYLYKAYKLEKNGGTKEHIFTRNRLYGIALNMLMEGTETVSGTLYGMLIEISKHLEEQKLVQKELNSVVGQERLPCWTDRLKMPYFKAFLQELGRVTMPFNISTYYSNFEETTLQGYRIPKKSMILANLWTINNDPIRYPEPSKFDPSRFLGESGDKLKNQGPCIFGVGKRTCIVESLAEKEIFLIIASILQNFTVFPVDKGDLLKAVPRHNATLCN